MKKISMITVCCLVLSGLVSFFIAICLVNSREKGTKLFLYPFKINSVGVSEIEKRISVGVSEAQRNLGCCCKSELRKWIGKRLYRIKPAQTGWGLDSSFMISPIKLLTVTCENLVFESGESSSEKYECKREIWDDGGWALFEEPNVKERQCCPFSGCSF